jgi:hypothetical protein
LNTKEDNVSSLTFIGSFQNRAPYAGASITDDLGAFVAMRRWDDKGLYVLDVKFFAASTGQWLKRCPYAKEFQKHFTIYDGDLDFARALRDFCHAHGVRRLGYSEQDIEVNAGTNIEPVSVDAERLAKACEVLKQISPLKDKRDAKAVLAYFLDSTEQTAPVLAILYAIAAVERTPREIANAEQHARELAAEIEAEVAACGKLPGNTVCMQVGGYEGTRWVPKETAIYMIKNLGVRLARGQHSNA